MGTRRQQSASFFEKFARAATRATGSTPAFMVAAGLILVWLATGPIFHFSDTWQLIINTGTTIVTFLMVFLIQRSQNNDSRAVHLKLNEIVAALDGASTRLVNVEDLSEDELKVLHNYYKTIAELAKRDLDLRKSHSIEEAANRHQVHLAKRKNKQA